MTLIKEMTLEEHKSVADLLNTARRSLLQAWRIVLPIYGASDKASKMLEKLSVTTSPINKIQLAMDDHYGREWKGASQYFAKDDFTPPPTWQLPSNPPPVDIPFVDPSTGHKMLRSREVLIIDQYGDPHRACLVDHWEGVSMWFTGYFEGRDEVDLDEYDHAGIYPTAWIDRPEKQEAN